MVIITKYTLEGNEGENGGEHIYYVRAEEESSCPVCFSKLKRIGRRKRRIVMSDGVAATLSISRMKCGKCGKIHHELPDCVVPYKRHCAKTIESIISGDVENACCEDSTIRKTLAWWGLLQIYARAVRASLAMKYGAVWAAAKKLPDIVRMLANSNSWPSTRSALWPG